MKFSYKHGFPADCREHGGQPPLYLQAILIPTIKISFKTITWQKNSILWQTPYRFCVKFLDINYWPPPRNPGRITALTRNKRIAVADIERMRQRVAGFE
jgi:hypothetical protein